MDSLQLSADSVDTTSDEEKATGTHELEDANEEEISYEIDKIAGLPPGYELQPAVKIIVEKDKFIINHKNLTEPFITPIEDVKELYAKVSDNLSKDSSETKVMLELTNVFKVLTLSRLNEKELYRTLKMRDEEIERLNQRMYRDPRLGKMIAISDEWRREKMSADELNDDLRIELMKHEEEAKSSLNVIASQKKTIKRLQDEIARMMKVTEKVHGLESSNMAKENTIDNLEKQIGGLKEQIQREIKKREAIKSQPVVEQDKHTSLLLEQSQKKIDSLRHEIVECFEKNDMLTREKEKRDKMIRELKEKLGFSKYITTMTREMGMRYKSQVKIMEGHLTFVTDKNNKLLKKIQEMETQINFMQTTLKNDEKVLQGSENDKMKMRFILSSKDNKISKDLTKIQKLYKELEERDDRIDLLRKDQNQTQQTLQEEQRTNDILRAITEHRNGSLRRKKIEIKKLSKNYQFLGYTAANLLTCYNRAVGELQRLEYQVKEISTDNFKKTNAIRNLSSMCANHVKVIRQEQRAFQKREAHVHKLETKIFDMSEKNEDLKQRALVAQSGFLNHMEQYELLQTKFKRALQEEETAIEMVNSRDKMLKVLYNTDKARVRQMNAHGIGYSKVLEKLKSTREQLQLAKDEALHFQVIINRLILEEPKKQKKILTYQRERDLMMMKYLQKSTECSLLEKRMVILERIINRGKGSFQQMSQGMCLLRGEINNLRTHLRKLQHTESTNATLRTELLSMTKEMTLMKVKEAKSKDFIQVRPHRNRELLSSNEGEFLRLLKIQSLTKRLITKTNTVVYLEQESLKKDKEIMQIKALLARRPGPAYSNMLFKSKQAIIEKDKTIRALRGELNMVNTEMKKADQLLEHCTKSSRKMIQSKMNSQKKGKTTPGLQEPNKRPLPKPQELPFKGQGFKCLTRPRTKGPPYKPFKGGEKTQKTEFVPLKKGVVFPYETNREQLALSFNNDNIQSLSRRPKNATVQRRAPPGHSYLTDNKQTGNTRDGKRDPNRTL